MKSVELTVDDLWALSSAVDTKLLSIEDEINATTSEEVRQRLKSNADNLLRTLKKIRGALDSSC
jgi:hypothetical protein